MSQTMFEWISRTSFIFVVVGALLYFFGALTRRMLDSLVGRATEKTNGTYLGVGHYLVMSRTRVWIPRVRYTIGGNTFERDAAFAEHISEQSDAGTPVEIFYDPNDPGFVYVFAQGKRSSFATMMLFMRTGVVLITLSLLAQIGLLLLHQTVLG